MNTNFQHVSELIEKNRREADAMKTVYKNAIREHEIEIQRIVIESQVEMFRMLCRISYPLHATSTKRKGITVPM